MMRKRVISILTFFIFLVAGFVYLDKVFESRHFYVNTTEDFKELAKETDIDLIFYGSSHIYTAFNPLIINQKSNIISYNLASDALLLPVTDLVLKESLKYARPKVIVLEVYRAGFAGPKTKSQKGFQLRALDFVSNFSLEKINRVGKLYKRDEFFGAFSTLIRNHTEWNDQDYFNLDRRVKTQKGREFYYNGYIGYNGIIKESRKYKGFQNIPINRDSTITQVNNNTKRLLNDFIDLAKQNNIEVLLVYTPDIRARSWNYHLFDELQRFADSKNVGLLNLNDYYSEMNLDVLDFMDSSHLNNYGSIKTSNFLADYINENYNLPNRSSENIFKDQTEGYDAFIANHKPYESIVYHKKVDQTLLEGFQINDIEIIKEQKDKLFFSIDFGGSLKKPNSLKNYQLAIHVFPHKSDINSLNGRSKARHRDYDVHGYLFENKNDTINIEFDSNIVNIEKVEFFLYDKDGFDGVVGERILVDDLESNRAGFNTLKETSYYQKVNQVLMEELAIADFSILKDHWDSLSFTINLRGELKKPLAMENYILAVHIFPKKSDLHLLNESSKSRNRDYEIHGYQFENETNSINVKFDTNISEIEKIEFFLYNKEGFVGVVGEKVIIDGISSKNVD